MAADKNKRNSRFTTAEERALEFLMQGYSIAETAREVGLKRSTVSMWVHREGNFRDELDKLCSQMHQENIKRIKALVGKSIDVLSAILDSPSVQPSTKLKAVAQILSFANAPVQDNQFDKPSVTINNYNGDTKEVADKVNAVFRHLDDNGAEY